MALTREQKEDILSELSDIFAADQTVAFLRFDHLPVKRFDALRSGLRDNSVDLKVAKKTLLNLALDSEDIDGDKPELPGQIALAYGGEVTAAARGSYQFETDDKTGEELEIVGGVFQGEFKDQEAMTKIAQIPSGDDLRAMFVNVIASPINGFAVTLNERAKKLN